MWADEIVFVEPRVRELAEAHFHDELHSKEIRTLNLPDIYEWNDPELRGIILRQYQDVAS